ncbi:N amino acid transport system protein [Lachnellula hyalina]|uniref:N amino acid transport system protein n=1 Tax=Lachnellula hyalina TaxID=1316788 RepID=A0A8H8U0G8_9HELO|nr:N amino acid transport system protein [Lachnellula hyalina]TVY29274.1 N amino acid transport system protein [Lachnellula hyalina]
MSTITGDQAYVDSELTAARGTMTEHVLTVDEQVEIEQEHGIKYRSCSWQKTAALLFAQYRALPIMSLPAAYSALGIFLGLLMTLVMALIVLYTSLILWKFCIQHPEVRDFCDVGQVLFGGKRWAWYFTAALFLLNNVFVSGIHLLIGARYVETISHRGWCAVSITAIMSVICLVGTLPRTFAGLSKVASATAFCTFIAVLLATIFAGIEPHPAGYNSGKMNNGLLMDGMPHVHALPKGTTFMAGMNAFLNITYTLIGQITMPSYIAEMRHPEDFPKAIWSVMVCNSLLCGLVGSVIYAYVGDQYMTSPAFSSISNETYRIVSFSFMVPTLSFTGVLYSSVSAHFVFDNLFAGSRHRAFHTVQGWAAWIGILMTIWGFTFVLTELIPFFGDMLALMSALFDSFFGFTFWGMACLQLRRTGKDSLKGDQNWLVPLVGGGLIISGTFVLGVGMYVNLSIHVPPPSIASKFFLRAMRTISFSAVLP